MTRLTLSIKPSVMESNAAYEAINQVTDDVCLISSPVQRHTHAHTHTHTHTSRSDLRWKGQDENDAHDIININRTDFSFTHLVLEDTVAYLFTYCTTAKCLTAEQMIMTNS